MKYKNMHKAMQKTMQITIINIFAVAAMMTSLTVNAEEGAIRFSNKAFKQVITKAADGTVSVDYVEPELVLPKDVILYEIEFENISDQPVDDIVINNPIANNSAYREGSATDDVAEVTFSVDGKTFAPAGSLTVKDSNGRTWQAKPEDYTAIRWTYKGSLQPGEKGMLSYKTVIK